MMKKMIVLFAALMLLLIGCTENVSTPDPTEPEGRLYQVDGFKIAVVEGSITDMGQQLGNLMRSEILQLYNLMIGSQINMGVYDFGYLLTQANSYWDNVLPSWLKALSNGMSISTSLSLDQIKVLQTWSIITADSSEGSGVIAWDEYTDGGAVLLGYNLDKVLEYDYGRLLCVTVYKPTDAPHDFAVVGFPGIFSITVGMNDAGLSIAKIEAPMADVFASRNVSIPWRELRSWDWLMNYQNLNELRVAFLSAPVALGGNFLICDPLEGLCFETAIDGMFERIPDAGGLICETNHFTSPYLQSHNTVYFEQDSTTTTISRRENLLRMAEEHKPGLTITTLIDSVMLLPYSHGGVENNTIVSLSFRPSDQLLIIESPRRLTQAIIDLKVYFE